MAVLAYTRGNRLGAMARRFAAFLSSAEQKRFIPRDMDAHQPRLPLAVDVVTMPEVVSETLATSEEILQRRRSSHS